MCIENGGKPAFQEEHPSLTLVVIESPFAGNREANIKYARACMADALRRGEAPYASHLLFTQEGILDDSVPEERKLGIEAGLAWGRMARKTVVYTDLGISEGMCLGIARALREGRKIEYRTLPENIEASNCTG